jgi:hypothetical protein
MGEGGLKIVCMKCGARGTNPHICIWRRWRTRRQERKEQRAAARAAARAPKPLCGHQGWRYWMLCDLPEGHDGDHGTIIGSSQSTGPFVNRTSVTRQMW